MIRGIFDILKRVKSAPALTRSRFPLGLHWPTFDPFLFVAHHRDHYPEANESFGPAVSLQGRRLGMDFGGIDGWNMYHGSEVPGFPQHPHRGFETITYARHGFIDHSDSMGAIARFGRGDTQWMTAGSGVVHAEMFPLLDADAPNPVELFQIWLNLPRSRKMVTPYFTMNWAEHQARFSVDEVDGVETELEIVTIVGAFTGETTTGTPIELRAPAPPPDSWAADETAGVAITHIRMAGETGVRLRTHDHQAVYVFDGDAMNISTADGGTDTQKGADEVVASGTGFQPVGGVELELSLVQGSDTAGLDGGAGDQKGYVECLIMEGRPLNEPVAQYGPFVMNTKAEISEAFADYQSTGFGGWPWPRPDPVHGARPERFARHPDGRTEQPPATVE